MKTHRLVFSVLVLGISFFSGGCVSLDRNYEFTLKRPTPNLYFAEIRWQTAVRVGEDKNWEEKVNELAVAAIRSEFLRLGLPCDTIILEHPTPYIGWVVVHVTVSAMSADDVRKEEAEFWKTHVSGQRIPPIVQEKRTFPSKEPNQSSQPTPGS